MATYRKLRILGSGGFGKVWKVKRLHDGEEFAAKYLDDEGGVSDVDRERFRREVRLLKSLEHPNIIEVIGTHLMDEPLWYVLPLYKGSLREHIEALVSDERWRTQVVDQILAAIEHAHENGVIHRDLKPENILVGERGDVVVSDFGLGRQVDSESTRKTRTGQRMGTPHYRAPEQVVDGKSVTHLADIYSLGRMIYEFYTGDPPEAQQDLEKLGAGIKRLVARCTRPRPEDRYQSVSDLRRDFSLIASGRASRRREDSIAEVLAAIVEGTPGDTEWECLRDAIEEAADNPELLHETFMEMPPAIYGEMEARFPDVTRDAAKAFGDFVGTSSWSFEYCDKIARVLIDFYRESRDPDTKVSLVEALFVLGASHNRFYVIGKFKEYLNTVDDPGEILAVRDMMERYPQWTRMFRDSLLKQRIPEAIYNFLRRATD